MNYLILKNLNVLIITNLIFRVNLINIAFDYNFFFFVNLFYIKFLIYKFLPNMCGNVEFFQKFKYKNFNVDLKKKKKELKGKNTEKIADLIT